MKRLGAVIVFRDRVTRKEAARALARVADVVEVPDERWKKVGLPSGVPSLVKEFDDEFGYPVFYIP